MRTFVMCLSSAALGSFMGHFWPMVIPLFHFGFLLIAGTVWAGKKLAATK